MEWSIRGLLNPVITRLLIYGVNPIDVEYVLTSVEKTNHLNARSLEKAWAGEWEKKAQKYLELAQTAEKNKCMITAGELFMQAAQCYYAIFLINQGNIEDKKSMYARYAAYYQKSQSSCGADIEKLSIPLKAGALSGYLHRPSGKNETKTGAVIFSGLGSCKEEMHLLADPLVKRGVTVFVPDMPGNGETLFSNGITCNVDILENAFVQILNELQKRPDLKDKQFGSYGLCMGGGYAFRAACLDSRYSFCVTLFPLLITKVQDGSTPLWMKQSDWAKYQMGHIPPDQFLFQMSRLEQGSIRCPFLFIHGKHDNWMTLQSAMAFFDRAEGPKEKLIIETEPVFSNQQAVTHTMPVGEQLHWVKHTAADWITGLEMSESGRM